MRIARVIGKVTLNRKMSEVQPGAHLIVHPYSRDSLAGKNHGNADDTRVVFDCLAAREGDLIGLAEGREACSPFRPLKVPYDAYCACILDDIDYQPVLTEAKK